MIKPPNKDPDVNKWLSRSYKYFKFRSTIYGRVVFIITMTSVCLFILFSGIFRTVYGNYFNNALRENGNNIGAVVEGALYHSMLRNDKTMLHNTLDVINTMPGIEDVNMYNETDNLVYSSFHEGADSHSNPDCISCHTDLNSMFPRKERGYRIIDEKSDCSMNPGKKGERHLLIRRPILNESSCYTAACHAHDAGDEILGSLIIRLPLREMDRAVKRSLMQFLILALIITVLMIVFLVYFTRVRIKDPLNHLIQASDAVSGGDITKRLPITPDLLDDMKKVSMAFNNMMDNISSARDELENWSKQLEYKVQKKSEELSEAQNELINVERIASLGKLSSSVAHEINNPLSGILVYTKLVYKQLSGDDITPEKKEAMLKHLRLIESETKRCGGIVKGLLDFSRNDQDDFEEKHLHEILGETYNLMMHHIKISNITFIKDFAATSDLVWCSPNKIKQAIMAIVVNASEAVTDNGEIILRTRNPNPETIRIEVSDNGSGIAATDIPHIFEPFFTTKRDAKGIGLGLPIVHGIVQSHNGKIEVNSTVGKGTTISINIPLRKS